MCGFLNSWQTFHSTEKYCSIFFRTARITVLFSLSPTWKFSSAQTEETNWENIVERLQLLESLVKGRSYRVRMKLTYGPVPDCIEIDVPAIRRL